MFVPINVKVISNNPTGHVEGFPDFVRMLIVETNVDRSRADGRR